MKRPMLVTGITTIVISVLLLLFKSAYTIVLSVSAVVLIFYFIKHFKLRKHVIIPTICITSILLTLSLLAYNKTNVTPYLKFDQTENTFCGKIISTPKEINGNLVFDVKADKIGTDETSTTITVKVPYYDDTQIALYDYICINDAYFSVTKDENQNYALTDISDGCFLYASAHSVEVLYQCPKTPIYYCLSFKNIVDKTISDYMTTEHGALLKGMIYGDTSSLSENVSTSFRNSGIAHLFAVSGLHTSLWCGLLIAILSSFKVPEKISSIICFNFLILFCIISGLTPSVIRASVMMTIILLAPFFKRLSDGINSLGLAITCLLLHNPYIVLSISFQLSVSSTFGVLIARNFYPKIAKLTNKINYIPLRFFSTSLIKSVLISCLACLFTLPASSYYFGTLCTIAPVTNILCVQLAFYGMIIGTAAVFFTFIKIPLIKSFTLLLFDITEFILNIVVQITAKIGELKYATIPVDSNFLYLAILTSALILSLGYILAKFKKNTNFLRITALVTAVEIVAITFIPLYNSHFKNTVTIASCGNGIQLVIRSGLNYAYIENTSATISTKTKNALPVATSEELMFYVPIYLSKTSLLNIETINKNYHPQNTVMPSSLSNFAKNNGIKLHQNTKLSNQGKFTLSSEITFEIVDTTGIKYVIIKCNGKTMLVHLHGETDFYKVLDDNNCFVAVYNSVIPQNTPANASKIILSIDENYNPVELKNFNSRNNTPVHVTATDGNAVIYF